MIELLGKIGVKENERRSVIMFLLAVLVIGNVVWFFMSPQYFELSDALQDFEKKNQKLAKEAGETELDDLKMSVSTLKKEMGEVPDKKQASELQAEIYSKGVRSGLNFTRSRGAQGGSRKNKDFDEERRTVTFQASTEDLVEFLKNMSEEEKSMIRVGSLNVSPTSDRKKLKVDLTFVASYPKNNEVVETKPAKPKTPTQSKPKK